MIDCVLSHRCESNKAIIRLHDGSLDANSHYYEATWIRDFATQLDCMAESDVVAAVASGDSLAVDAAGNDLPPWRKVDASTRRNALEQLIGAAPLSDLPDFRKEIDRYFPLSLMRLLGEEELLKFGDHFVQCVKLLERRPFGRNNVKRSPTSIMVNYMCGRKGMPVQLTAEKKRATHSDKCGCKASARISNSTGVTLQLNHVPECREEDMTAKVRGFFDRLQGLHPNLEEELVGVATAQLKADYSVRPVNVKRVIRARLEEKKLGDVSDAVVVSILRKSLVRHLQGIDVKNSIAELIRILQNGYRFTVKKKTTHIGDQLSAVHMQIPSIAPGPEEDMWLFTADVTHGLIDARSGLKKTSFISAITPGRVVRPVVVSLIEHEDESTFASELAFLLSLSPSLADKEIIFLVDGDRGRIAAIRNALRGARIYLCLWHKGENVKSHVNPHLHALRRKAGNLSLAELKQQLADMGVMFPSRANKATLQELLDKAVQRGLLAEVPSQDEAPGAATTSAAGFSGEATPTTTSDEDLIQQTVDDLVREMNASDDAEVDGQEDLMLPPALAPPTSSSSASLSLQQPVTPPPASSAPAPLPLRQPATPPPASSSSASLRTSGSAGPSPEGSFPAVNSFTSVTSRAIFGWLRGGRNSEETTARMEYLVTRIPALESYVNGELKSTVIYWADWARVWGLTFGLTTSTLQENLHWSLKARLRGNSVSPHMFIEFLEKTLGERQNRISYNRTGDKPLQQLKSEMRLNGFGSVLEACERHMRPDGLQVVLTEFEHASRYDVRQLLGVEEAREILPIERRGASAYRFQLLLELDEMSEVTLFAVTLRADAANVDVVCRTPAGSVVCTCGDVCALGHPDRHVFAVVRCGLLAFSPVHHLHPLYWRAATLASQEVEAVWVGATRPSGNFTSAGRWNEAYELTRQAWLEKGIGPEGKAALVWHSPAREKARSECSALLQEVKKVFHDNCDRARSNAASLRALLAHEKSFQQLLARNASSSSAGAAPVPAATVAVDGGSLILPSALPKESSKRAKMSSDHRKAGRRVQEK